jgi:hypothetical protein
MSELHYRQGWFHLLLDLEGLKLKTTPHGQSSDNQVSKVTLASHLQVQSKSDWCIQTD